MSLLLVERWVRIGANMVRPGRPARTPSEVDPGTGTTDRDLLVYGTYEPDYSQVGVIGGTVLTAYNPSTTNDFVTLPAGTTLSNKIIYGDVKALGPATLTNCSIVGGTWNPATWNDAVNGSRSNNIGCLTMNESATRSGVVTCIDCTIKPRTEADGRDCVIGRQYELYRCHLSCGVDGIGIYSSTVNTNVKVQGCLIEDLAFMYPDQTHSDGTHNDGLQFQGGQNVYIMGNSFRGTGHHMAGSGNMPTYPWNQTYAQGSGIIIQRNGTMPLPNNTVIFEKNYIRGFMTHINIKPGIAFIYRDNWHYRDVAVGTGWSGYYIRYDDSTTTVTGINSNGGKTITNTTNKWKDGPYINTALNTPRDKGIHFNV